ncbi:MAG: hypothetical protein IPL79_20220 [Myxococcales bacterium]|nr:hypothetical protein [Myxococcales bacterium]
MSHFDKSDRDNFFTGKVRAYLDRRTAPRGIADKPQVVREELAALVRCVLRFAPTSGMDEWWQKFEDRLAEESTTRAWPTEGEIKKAALSLRGTTQPKFTQGYEADPLAINAGRMSRGEAVGDGFLYGRPAVALLRAGYVTPAQMAGYRSGLFFSAKSVYGEAVALNMESEWKKRHADAECLDDTPRQRGTAIPAPKRIAAHDWDGEGERV